MGATNLPRPNTEQQAWILLPLGGYPYGVEAGPGLSDTVELHGGFATYAQASEYAGWLRREYSDYTYAHVVKIETPQVSA